VSSIAKTKTIASFLAKLKTKATEMGRNGKKTWGHPLEGFCQAKKISPSKKS